jgi:outer membrane protein, heavy metal efflux system
MIVRLLILTALAVASYAQSYSPNDDEQLDLYIQQALERNPAVRQAFSRYQAAKQKMPQVSALPDPVLSITQYLRSPETRVGPQTTMFSLAQKFPWFGKLSDREKIAAKEAAVVREQYEAQQAEMARQVKTAYYSLAYLDRAVAITEEDLSLLGHYETLAQARYTQGVGLQQGVVKLQAEITRDKNRLSELSIQRVRVESALNRLMDRPAKSPIGRIGLDERPTVEIDYEKLFGVGRTHRPEVIGALLRVEKDEKRIQLAKRSYWPDFTLGASFVNVLGRRDPLGSANPPDQNGKNVWAITGSVNIPIQRRKYDAAVLEATEEKIASQEGYRDVVNSIESAVRSVGFEIETTETQIALFEDTLLPQAEQALRSSEAAYSTGTLGVLDLLDSERVLLNVRLGLAQLNTDYMKSLADMERAIGAAFPEVK